MCVCTLTLFLFSSNQCVSLILWQGKNKARKGGGNRRTMARRAPKGFETQHVVPPPAMSQRLDKVVPLQSFNPVEQHYLAGMKKRDLDRLNDVLTQGGKLPRQSPPLRIRVLQSNLPGAVKVSVFERLKHGGCEKYVAWVEKLLHVPLGVNLRTVLPQGTTLQERLAMAQAVMDGVIVGHAEAKREVLKLVCQDSLRPDGARSYALGLEGPPGTGKTRFVQEAIGPALHRPVVHIPLGGAIDTAFLLGHIYTYEGSREGRLVSGLIESKCMNPVFHFDELDKVSATERGGEIISVLIHLIDPTSNATMRDRYFHEVDVDFSRATCVFTYNDASRVNPILLDRITRVKMDRPSKEDAVTIVKQHVVPKLVRRYGMNMHLGDAAIRAMVDSHHESGMRTIERLIERVYSSALLSIGTNVGGVVDERGEIQSDFVASQRVCVDGDGASQPPLGMYM